MASRLSLCSSSPMITTPNYGPLRRWRTASRSTVTMCANDHISVDLHIRSQSHKNKVFEDRTAGIVCYRDKNGEITCEGYDEGPRFPQQLSRFSFITSSRDVEIIPMLERSWLHQLAADN